MSAPGVGERDYCNKNYFSQYLQLPRMCLLWCLPKMQDHMLSVVGWSCSPPTTYIAVLTMASTRQFSSTTRLPARI
jgi:hypothetical protein